MNYSIYHVPQVSPKYFTMQILDDHMGPPDGPTHPEQRLNPVPKPAYPATFTRLLWRAPDLDPYSADPAHRVEIWEDSAGTATFAEVKAAAPGLVTQVTDYIKQIRAAALEKFPKNAGVLAVYEENYRAACAVAEGRGGEIMKDGSTATGFMARFGARLGMSAEQFAGYIIAENRRVNPTAVQIEERYLALCYGGDPAAGIVPVGQLPSIDAMRQAVIDYAAFCGETSPW